MKRRETIEQAIVAAVEREHKRIASDLHDGVCQELAGVAMMLDMIRLRVVSDVASEIGVIAEQIRLVTLGARRLALGLAPIAVEQAGMAGALALLKMDVERLKGPVVTLSIHDQFGILPLDVAANLYRIAQEATANALRHSRASRINIAAEVRDGRFLLAIQDDGCGIRDSGHEFWGLGIKSMASRAKLLGGNLKLLHVTPQGTRVQVTLPARYRPVQT